MGISLQGSGSETLLSDFIDGSRVLYLLFLLTPQTDYMFQEEYRNRGFIWSFQIRI
jgi:hypothetical protein